MPKPLTLDRHGRLAQPDWTKRTGQMYATIKRRTKHGLPFTLAEFREWVESQGQDRFWQCTYCMRSLTIDQISVDHTIPLNQGGLSWLANMAITCKNCNYLKGSLSGAAWADLYNTTKRWGPVDRNHLWQRLRFNPAMLKGRRK